MIKNNRSFAWGLFLVGGVFVYVFCLISSAQEWQPVGGGTDYAVYCLDIYGGNVFAGGRFDTAGGVTVYKAAKWNGSTWGDMQGGVYGPDCSIHPVKRLEGMVPHKTNSVSAFARSSSGILYAGGCFDHAGGIVVNSIAKWDGAQWNALGSGMNNSVFALAMSPLGILYAGGPFTMAGGKSASYVAQWDGVQWTALDSGVGDVVHALAIDKNGALYVGGDFMFAGSRCTDHIAKWSNGTWSYLGSSWDSQGVNGRVYALAVGPDNSLYVGGEFTEAAGKAIKRIAKWDGVNWSSLGTGMTGPTNYTEVNVLTFGPDGALYAGGCFTNAGGVKAHCIAKWNGYSWNSLNLGLNNSVWDIKFAPDGTLYAGGWFDMASNTTVNYIAKYNPNGPASTPTPTRTSTPFLTPTPTPTVNPYSTRTPTPTMPPPPTPTRTSTPFITPTLVPTKDVSLNAPNILLLQ